MYPPYTVHSAGKFAKERLNTFFQTATLPSKCVTVISSRRAEQSRSLPGCSCQDFSYRGWWGSGFVPLSFRVKASAADAGAYVWEQTRSSNKLWGAAGWWGRLGDKERSLRQTALKLEFEPLPPQSHHFKNTTTRLGNGTKEKARLILMKNNNLCKCFWYIYVSRRVYRNRFYDPPTFYSTMRFLMFS